MGSENPCSSKNVDFSTSSADVGPVMFDVFWALLLPALPRKASTWSRGHSPPPQNDPHPIVPGRPERCAGRRWLPVRPHRPPMPRSGANYSVMWFSLPTAQALALAE